MRSNDEWGRWESEKDLSSESLIEVQAGGQSDKRM